MYDIRFPFIKKYQREEFSKKLNGKFVWATETVKHHIGDWWLVVVATNNKDGTDPVLEAGYVTNGEWNVVIICPNSQLTPFIIKSTI